MTLAQIAAKQCIKTSTKGLVTLLGCLALTGCFEMRGHLQVDKTLRFTNARGKNSELKPGRYDAFIKTDPKSHTALVRVYEMGKTFGPQFLRIDLAGNSQFPKAENFHLTAEETRQPFSIDGSYLGASVVERTYKSSESCTTVGGERGERKVTYEVVRNTYTTLLQFTSAEGVLGTFENKNEIRRHNATEIGECTSVQPPAALYPSSHGSSSHQSSGGYSSSSHHRAAAAAVVVRNNAMHARGHR